MKRLPRSGLTLIEVIVASGLLVVVATLVTSALTSTFEGYQSTQTNVALDQEGQYIMARLNYATSRSDEATLLFLHSGEDFSEGTFIDTELSVDGTVRLQEGALYGEYVSPIISLDVPSLANSAITQINAPQGSLIRTQIAIADKVGGGCEAAAYEYVGTTGTQATYLDFPYSQIPPSQTERDFQNPGQCMRMRVLFSRTLDDVEPILMSIKVQK